MLKLFLTDNGGNVMDSFMVDEDEPAIVLRTIQSFERMAERNGYLENGEYAPVFCGTENRIMCADGRSV